jgi:tRNA(Ile)-lysidine synthase
MASPARTTVEKRVRRAFASLAPEGRGVVVGLSGGADSTALLSALVALRASGELETIVAAHLDHGLRGSGPGSEAARDRDAAAALAARLGVDFVAGKGDARLESLARGTGSLEAAARAVRYRFLLEVAHARDLELVAVAHTADDQAETVLLRAARGTGLRGLAGIPRRRSLGSGVDLVRPLLRATRAEVLAHLAARDLTWVEDGSNADPRFTRNRVRRELLPLLRDVSGPGVDAALRRLADQARAADRFVAGEARALLVRARLARSASTGHDVAALLDAPAAVRDRALAELIQAHGAPDGLTARHVRLLRGALRRGGAVTLPGGCVLSAEGGALRAVEAPSEELAPAPALSLPVPGVVVDEAAGLIVRATLRPARPDDVGAHDDGRSAVLDAGVLDATSLAAVSVRRRRAGDRFWPLGAPGGRTLKRFLIDRKVPRDERGAVPVVTFDDRPAWIVGHRIDERLKVTPATTTVLELEVRPVAGEKGI